MFANLNKYRAAESRGLRRHYRRKVVSSLIDSVCWIYAAPLVAGLLAMGALVLALLVCRAFGYDAGFQFAGAMLGKGFVGLLTLAQFKPLWSLVFDVYLLSGIVALARVSP